MTRYLLPFVAVCLFGQPAIAHEFKAGDLLVDHPIIREAPPNAPVLGGYLTVTNRSASEDRLVAIETDLAERVELHRSSVTDSIARMTPMDEGLIVPAGGRVRLGEDGTHAMFIGPSKRLAVGDKVPAVLVFEKAGRLDVVFNVEKRDDESAHGAH